MGLLRRAALSLLLGFASASPALERRTEIPVPQNVTVDPLTKLPIVDLGYELHRAYNYNVCTFLAWIFKSIDR